MIKNHTARPVAERCIPPFILKHYKEVLENSAKIEGRMTTPTYCHDLNTIAEQVKFINRAMPDGTRMYVPLFTVGLPPLVAECDKLIANGGILCNTLDEVNILMAYAHSKPEQLMLKPERIIVTSSGIPSEDLAVLARQKIYVNLDSRGQLDTFALEGGRECGLRVQLDIEPPPGTRVPAIGAESTIGIPVQDVAESIRQAEKNCVIITGLHIYPGTNILDYRENLKIVDHFIEFIKTIPAEFRKRLKTINIGGGFGIDYGGSQSDFDFVSYGMEIRGRLELLKNICSAGTELAIEPGRSIFAKAGVLLTRVVDVKGRKDRQVVNVDASCTQFSRYWIYGINHPIVAVEKLDEELALDSIVRGYSTLRADVLGEAKFPSSLAPGDPIMVLFAGAYGYSMSGSNYLGKLRPSAWLVKNDEIHLIARRQTLEDVTRLFVT
ncbi:MAG: hypothetical protein Q7T16_06155 [Candidatus Burarchaeum sp.]|nr:hypothetical protein [Candidatus Burarchaeum sp.]MDO8340211.1 hypothetical protein [Candidatus Burarchaeum sp.]